VAFEAADVSDSRESSSLVQTAESFLLGTPITLFEKPTRPTKPRRSVSFDAATRAASKRKNSTSNAEERRKQVLSTSCRWQSIPLILSSSADGRPSPPPRRGDSESLGTTSPHTERSIARLAYIRPSQLDGTLPSETHSVDFPAAVATSKNKNSTLEAGERQQQTPPTGSCTGQRIPLIRSSSAYGRPSRPPRLGEGESLGTTSLHTERSIDRLAYIGAPQLDTPTSETQALNSSFLAFDTFLEDNKEANEQPTTIEFQTPVNMAPKMPIRWREETCESSKSGENHQLEQ
jgi:hypothetical protein